MYNTLKKISMGFIFLNVFMFQSLMADMIFYYNAAILPSIISKGASSPVCPPKVVLNDVDGVYNAIIDNLSFVQKDGRRAFMPKLDTTRYAIDESFYVNAAPFATLNPLFFVSYEDVNTSYETRASLEISQAKIENNMTWNYQEVMVENNDGNKTISTEGEGGTWAYEIDDSMTLSNIDAPVVNVKVIRTISTNEIINILENAGINLTLDSTDTAQLNIEKSLQNWYWWDNQVHVDATFETLGDFISMAAYNSSSIYANTVLIGERGAEGVAISFAANSTGTSGTLVEISSDNKLLSTDAGTWSIETITDDNGTFDVIVVDPILCGYEKRLIKLDAIGHVIYGGYEDVAGELNTEIAFSESLKEKLKAYFIENALLNVNPDGVPMTEEMLSDKTFYMKWEDVDVVQYRSVAVIAPGILSGHDIVYDKVSGDILYDGFFPDRYTLEGGLMKFDYSTFGGGFFWIRLDSETSEQWNMFYEDDPEMNGAEGIDMQSDIWFTSKPAEFPAELNMVETTPITEAMLSGKIFYQEFSDLYGSSFDKIEVLSSSQVQYTEVAVDSNGTIIASNTSTLNYSLSNGHILMDMGGDFTIISLISSDSVQWNMFVVDFWGTTDPYETWLLTEPAGFPQLP